MSPPADCVSAGLYAGCRDPLGCTLAMRVRLASLVQFPPRRHEPSVLGAPLAATESALAQGGPQQAELAAPLDRLSAAVHAELGVHVAQVGPDRVLGYEQLRRDLWPAEVGRQVAQHPKLALRQWFP